MFDTLRDRLLPETQRRTADELDDDLDLRSGDARAKQSAFWVMLVLSAIVASAGVITDSTATVIGAMIIAPLSTPIMGIALGLALGRRNGSVVYVTLGVITVVVIGLVFSLVVPQDIDLLSDSQIASRTSPGLADLVAAIATGFAGAIALCRRDVAAVLPGVAIAISLVPPLAVVGVCLGQGAPGLAAGAFLLFFSNLLAMVAAGLLTFVALDPLAERHARRRPGLVIAGLAVVIAVPLVANTVAVYAVDRYSAEVRSTASQWLASTPDAAVTSVDFTSPSDVRIYIRHTGDLPSYADLLGRLHGVIPDGIAVHVDASVGSEKEVGEVGAS